MTTATDPFAHGLLLLFDSYLRPTLLELVVPFGMSHARFWTGLGTVAGYVAGTDAGEVWLQVPFALTIGAVLALLGCV